MLHGHGRRSRQAWGPPGPQSPPETTDIAVRRYQCQRSGCGATVDVLPRSLRPRRRYTTAAIALALSLWSVEERSSRAVHKAVSPWALSFEAEWSSLRRWARQAERIFGSVRPSPPQWSLRQRAERAATTLAAQAPVPMNDAPVWARAFAGAEHDR